MTSIKTDHKAFQKQNSDFYALSLSLQVFSKSDIKVISKCIKISVVVVLITIENYNVNSVTLITVEAKSVKLTRYYQFFT
jgi:hypothetical protein